jgi:hypothetical protein
VVLIDRERPALARVAPSLMAVSVQVRSTVDACKGMASRLRGESVGSGFVHARTTIGSDKGAAPDVAGGVRRDYSCRTGRQGGWP